MTKVSHERREHRDSLRGIDDWGQGYTVTVHPKSQCKGQTCAVHNPSDHPLKDAPMLVRVEKYYLIERMCKHGVGHDDPDSVAFLASRYPAQAGGFGIHGCDGCCG